MVVRDGALLLVEYRCPGDTGHFSLPGGRTRPGESLAEALARKVREETCLEVRVGPLFLVVEYVPDRHGQVHGPLHRVQLLFRCTALDTGQEPRMPDTHEPGQYAVHWMPLTELPRIRLQPAVAEPLCEALAGPGGRDLLAW
ncbi:NUDIX domain-containing protein [Plantactinospora sp. B6F1]|uniref:NUDIX domain-containing protein n=1 Tax=Plantactinospora sp. B6F1 TaxID=3158971 RepID=UPI0032D99B59